MKERFPFWIKSNLQIYATSTRFMQIAHRKKEDRVDVDTAVKPISFFFFNSERSKIRNKKSSAYAHIKNTEL